MFYCVAHNLTVLVKGLHSKYLALIWSFGVIYLIVGPEPRTENMALYSVVVNITEFFVYWNVHHLDIWIKRDQLDVTCFIISLFNAQHVSDVNTSILESLRIICWVISWVVLIWFDVCWYYIVVWLWWCGIRMQAEALVLQPAYAYHTTPAKPQRNTNTRRTRAIQPMK